MPFYQRAFLYLFRKRTKTALLFLILLLVNSMILGTVMILHAAQTTQISIEKKSKAKAVCEITQDRDRISSQDISAVKQLPHITFLNRQAESPAYLSDFLPITASDSQKPENSQIHLTAYDDLEKDGPFATQNYRLTDGTLIQPQLDSSAVIHETFATVNGISIGNQIHLENEHGKTITVTVCGLFLSGNEHQQNNTLDSLYRIENQIFIDIKSYTTLFNSDQFNQLIVYTDQPGQTEALAEELQELFGEKAEVTSSDVLYQQMKAPLASVYVDEKPSEGNGCTHQSRRVQGNHLSPDLSGICHDLSPGCHRILLSWNAQCQCTADHPFSFGTHACNDTKPSDEGNCHSVCSWQPGNFDRSASVSGSRFNYQPKRYLIQNGGIM